MTIDALRDFGLAGETANGFKPFAVRVSRW